ncbi:MAG: hypothetical protein R3F59_31710 [Myxococcota bacterium]
MSLVLSALLLTPGAEAKEYKLLAPLNQVTAGETLTVAAERIEPQNDHYTVFLKLTNQSADRALMMSHDELQCWWGPSQAMLKHATFGIGERRIDLRPGESKTFPMNCMTGARGTGDFKVNILHVYDDSTGDLLLDDVSWTLTEAQMDKKANKTIPPGFVPAVTDHPVPPPAGAAPTEPEGVLMETVEAGANVVHKVVDKVEAEVEEHDGDDADAPEESP